MIAIVDYGVGNLFSLKSSFAAIGAPTVVSGDPTVLEAADRILLPGVGAFPDAARKLREAGLDVVLKQQAAKGKPLMGICLGMQLLFEKSYEYGECEGLGLIPGSVRPIRDVIDPRLKVPHIGWNALRFTKKKSDLFRYVSDGSHAYFVHSFYATDCQKDVIANCEYGGLLTAAVQRDNVYGCQFHPEKSAAVGLNILRAFCEKEG